MRTYSITPFQGALPLKFGMSVSEAETAIGQTLKITRNWQKKIVSNLSAESLSLGFGGAGDTLDHIGFGRGADVSYSGLHFFQERDAWRHLFDQSRDYHVVLGFLVFCDLGIALSGFHDGYDDELAVTIFPAGHWEKFRPQFQKYENEK